MNEYGVTPAGFVPKRLDEIRDGINQRIREATGIDVSINPQSVIQVLVTGIADEIAAMWETAQDAYYAMYPSSAEGISLDNAMQFGGVLRERDRRTVYNLKCTGENGTIIPYGTMVSSNTQPEKFFMCYAEQVISINSFREVLIRIPDPSVDYLSITINGESFQYVRVKDDPEKETVNPENPDTGPEDAGSAPDEAEKKPDTDETMVENFAKAIRPRGMTAEPEDVNTIRIRDSSGMSANILYPGENMMVIQVVSNILFESTEYGKISIPKGYLNRIYTNVSGLEAVTNDLDPVYGRFEATDMEARQDYIKQVMRRSSNMLDSIRAELYSLENVTAVRAWENDTYDTDKDGRPPKSIEILVEGGADAEIAQVIYDKKCVGIYPYGKVRYPISDPDGNVHDIGFSRPENVYVWLRVTLVAMSGARLPSNYVATVQELVTDQGGNFEIGGYITLQRLYTPIYAKVPNVVNIYISGYLTKDPQEVPTPEMYTLTNLDLSPREKALFAPGRIEVIMNE